MRCKRRSPLSHAAAHRLPCLQAAAAAAKDSLAAAEAQLSEAAAKLAAREKEVAELRDSMQVRCAHAEWSAGGPLVGCTAG